MTRFVIAVESMAVSLATMAKQQGEFLATLPADEEPSAYSELDESKGGDPVSVPAHTYNAACPCQACWAQRQRIKRDQAA